MLIIFVSALTVRALFCFVIIPRLGLAMGPRSPDFFALTDGYIDLARTLANHGKFAFAPEAAPTTYRAPLFPAVLAIGYRCWSDIAAVTMWINCLASSLTCVAVHRIAMIVLPPPVRLWVAAPVVLFPLSIYYCASSYSDTFFALTVALYVLALVRLVGRPTARSGVTTGLAFAAAALTKSIVLPLPLALVVFVRLKARHALRPLLLSLVVGLAAISPWTIRNYRVADAFIPVSGGIGFNMLVGHYMIDKGPDPGTSYLFGEAMALDRVRQDAGLELSREAIRTGDHLDLTATMDQACGRVATRMALNEPALMARKLGINAYRFFTFSSSAKKTLMNAAIHAGILMFVGVLAVRFRGLARPEGALVALVTGFFLFTYAAIIVHSCRFSMPVMLLLAPMAGWSAAHMLRRTNTNACRAPNGER